MGQGMSIMMVCCLMISVLISLVCGIIGIMAWVELRSFMKSTHKVEFVPLEQPDQMPALKKELYRDQDLNEYDI